jgi:hypothetical protein
MGFLGECVGQGCSDEESRSVSVVCVCVGLGMISMGTVSVEAKQRSSMFYRIAGMYKAFY